MSVGIRKDFEAMPQKRDNDFMTKRVLFALTSHDRKGSTGLPTGAYLAEVSHPHAVFAKHGIDVDFVSVKGGKVPLDGVDRKDPVNAAFLDDAALLTRLHNSMHPDAVDPSRYDAIFFAGGHGTMWDFADCIGFQRIASTIDAKGGVVSAVCHGPAALVNVRNAAGAYLVAGKRVAAFTNEEERGAGLLDVVPFLLADALKAHGAEHVSAAMWTKNVVVDGRLVTGQNPASAQGVAEAVLKFL
jgi:putative intracellular protease/amidase